ncbi:hypothetical protein GCM10007916_23470 [Psychromonas marina]|uniref:diguanylate cyclase n=1 Tax=Psychromonas marina TaxID=88364 RepID=A0ABQ6E1K3_9GAMM|nr:sensor domain-containing diguanylate cyclase [Psychromonas marina]GLS91278.1 hypothetical protein GCM10007916_23470 [Psychromonas marina]
MIKHDKEADFNLKSLIIKGLEISPDCFVVMQGEENKILYCNHTFADIFGSTNDQLVGVTNKTLLKQAWQTKRGINIETQDFDEWMARVNELHKVKEVNQFETDLTDGRWFRMTRMNLEQDIKIYFGVDITELKKLQHDLEIAVQQIERLANTDALTNISNRRFFEVISEKKFAIAKRYHKDFSVMLLDIDHFKKVNDNYGHEGGDDVLKALARMCTDMVRNTDTLCRIGGEEFVVLLPETNLKKAYILAERIRLAINKHDFYIVNLKCTVGISVSIGVSAIKEEDENVRDILNRADAALYMAKKVGRNRAISKKE